MAAACTPGGALSCPGHSTIVRGSPSLSDLPHDRPLLIQNQGYKQIRRVRDATQLFLTTLCVWEEDQPQGHLTAELYGRRKGGGFSSSIAMAIRRDPTAKDTRRSRGTSTDGRREAFPASSTAGVLEVFRLRCEQIRVSVILGLRSRVCSWLCRDALQQYWP